MTPELIARLEGATGPDREIDCEIWASLIGLQITWQGDCMVAGIEGVIGWIDPGKHQRNFTTNRSTTGPGAVPPFTASLDAAMTLVPEGCEVTLDWCHYKGEPADRIIHEAYVQRRSDGEDIGNGDGSSRALALTIACLRPRLTRVSDCI